MRGELAEVYRPTGEKMGVRICCLAPIFSLFSLIYVF